MEFDNRQLALDWIQQQKIWSYLRDYDTDKGRKDVYRCNLVKRREPQCQAEICLLYNSHNV